MVSGATTILRGASSVMTGGLANPLVATFEAGVALTVAALAVVFPILALTLVVSGVLFLGRKLLGRPRRTAA